MAVALYLQVEMVTWYGYHYWAWRHVRLDDAALQLLYNALKVIPPPQPGLLSVTQTGEDSMGLLYTLQLPAPEVPDVVTRTIEQKVDADLKTYPAKDGMALRYQQDQHVGLRLQDTDDAGNKSEWSEQLNFIAKDDMAPPAPGMLGVTPTGEDTNMMDFGPVDAPQAKKK